jgi:hypothetical protein
VVGEEGRTDEEPETLPNHGQTGKTHHGTPLAKRPAARRQPLVLRHDLRHFGKIVHELGLDFGCGQIGKDFAHQSQCGGDQEALLCLRPIAWWRAGASSFELLRYLFTNAPRQIVVVDYASRLVVEYHVTGIFPAATGPAVMGDVLNFQPSHNLEKNEQAKKNQKNLAAAPRDKAPRSTPHLFRSLIVGWQCEVPVLSKRIQSCAATIT